MKILQKCVILPVNTTNQGFSETCGIIHTIYDSQDKIGLILGTSQALQNSFLCARLRTNFWWPDWLTSISSEYQQKNQSFNYCHFLVENFNFSQKRTSVFFLNKGYYCLPYNQFWKRKFSNYWKTLYSGRSYFVRCIRRYAFFEFFCTIAFLRYKPETKQSAFV